MWLSCCLVVLRPGWTTLISLAWEHRAPLNLISTANPEAKVNFTFEEANINFFQEKC
jgi:hypothetical protein